MTSKEDFGLPVLTGVPTDSTANRIVAFSILVKVAIPLVKSILSLFKKKQPPVVAIPVQVSPTIKDSSAS
jgi:hypothetical protein